MGETAELDRKQTLMQQMCQMFVDLDDDGSGTVTWAEFEQHLENPQMVEYLKVIDLDPHEAKKLFSMLDLDGSGEIDGEELVSGCLRLHGSAKALELAAFMHEFGEFNRRWISHARRMERYLGVSSCAAQPVSSQHRAVASIETCDRPASP